MRSSFLSIIRGNWVPYYSSILQFLSTIQKYKTYEIQTVGNEQVNCEWEQKGQRIVDIDDDDDSKNNKVEEPTEQDKKKSLNIWHIPLATTLPCTVKLPVVFL